MPPSKLLEGTSQKTKTIPLSGLIKNEIDKHFAISRKGFKWFLLHLMLECVRQEQSPARLHLIGLWKGLNRFVFFMEVQTKCSSEPCWQVSFDMHERLAWPCGFVVLSTKCNTCVVVKFRLRGLIHSFCSQSASNACARKGPQQCPLRCPRRLPEN